MPKRKYPPNSVNDLNGKIQPNTGLVGLQPLIAYWVGMGFKPMVSYFMG